MSHSREKNTGPGDSLDVTVSFNHRGGEAGAGGLHTLRCPACSGHWREDA
jgi:hypothetical protein